jgi:4-amino-4-deoxy-L-arabinose transferase-like glycosyltransferase
MTTVMHDPSPARVATGDSSFPAFAIAAIIFCFALICYMPLPAGAPLAGTEGHRSVTAHQMVQSGQWIVPRMFGRIYLAKPPLHYWIMAAFEKLSGRATPFIWRLPSAIEAALTAAILSLFAHRWFNSVAGWTAGLSSIALVALWGENRGADIDVSNTLFTTLAALCLIQLFFGESENSLGWIFLAGLAVGGSFLVKGPASLTVILGTMGWIAISSFQTRRAGRLLSPAFWLPLLIGILILGIWVLMAWRYLATHHLPIDLTGVREGTQDLHPHDWSWKRAFEWLFFPVTLFLYSMPVSISLLFAMLPEVRSPDAKRSRLIIALAMSVLISWGICFISGMHTPRYGYVTLPLLCALAGGVAGGIPIFQPRLQQTIRAILIGAMFMFAIAIVVICVRLRSHQEIRPVVGVVGLVAVLITFIATHMVWHRRHDWAGLWGAPILLMSMSIAVGAMAYFDRLHRSSIVPALQIRGVTGPNAHLMTCATVLDQPELFYYADLPTVAMDGDMLDYHQVPLGTWVVLETQELRKWQAEVPGRLRKVFPFVANKNPGYLVWYDASPSTTQAVIQ